MLYADIYRIAYFDSLLCFLFYYSLLINYYQSLTINY